MNVVTAESRPDGTAARRSQRVRRCQSIPTSDVADCGADAGSDSVSQRWQCAATRDREQHDQGHVADAPQAALCRERQAWFDDQGVCKQRE